MCKVKRIIVIGPESTGKSTLCEQLAHYYNTSWCPEYAREYLVQHGPAYSYEDLLMIAKGQLQLMDNRQGIMDSDENAIYQTSLIKHLSLNIQHPTPDTQHKPLFFDTDMCVMKVWCEYVFGKCHSFILEKIAEQKADLYLLCNVDLEWVKDELREYPDLESRLQLFHIYKDLLVNQTVPWIVISGNYKERLKTAIGAVNKLL